MTTPDEILDFWFGTTAASRDDLIASFKRWGPGLDEEIRSKYLELIERAKRGELDAWTESHQGTLALILVLDQLPRHAYRGSAKQYEGDDKALALAQRADAEGWPSQRSFLERIFLTMPFAHSEKLEHHRRHIDLADATSREAPAWCGEFAKVGPTQARKYFEIINRFGRFPHRNAMLGRESTREEREWIESGGPERMPPEIIKQLG